MGAFAAEVLSHAARAWPGWVAVAYKKKPARELGGLSKYSRQEAPLRT